MLHGLSANQPVLQYRVFRMAVKAAFGQWIILRAGLSTDTGLRARRDFMDGEIGARLLFFLAQTNTHKRLQTTIYDETADQREAAADKRADQLPGKTHPAKATQCLCCLLYTSDAADE